jgi:ketosteroid isomerase-like protein
VIALPLAAPVFGQSAAPAAPTSRVLEVRGYNLKPGTRDRFHQLVVREALPLLQRAKIDVVSYGPSVHDNDSYFLMRSFESVDDRRRVENAFYGSEEWRRGPREAVLSHIISYTTVVITVDDPTLGGLRRQMNAPSTQASDLAALLALNEDYVRSVQTSDVKRFAEILADDFLCSLPDGTLIDRKGFLDHTAKPVAISGLAVHDVNVRLMGDFAIVHARTTFTLPDGRNSEGRYTDVWARRGGRWLAVAAHVTRK